MSLGRESLTGRENPERLAKGIDISKMRISSRRADDHFVCRVVSWTDLTAINRQRLGIWQGHQAEVANQPRAVQLVEIAWLNVAVCNIRVLLQPRQRVRDSRG